jgi:hypothetical protein
MKNRPPVPRSGVDGKRHLLYDKDEKINMKVLFRIIVMLIIQMGFDLKIIEGRFCRGTVQLFSIKQRYNYKKPDARAAPVSAGLR